MDDENAMRRTMAAEKYPPYMNFPHSVTTVIQKVLDDNAHKHGPAEWRNIHPAEHISHALQHLHRWVNFETTKLLHEANNLEPPEEEDEPHLEHALCRLAFAAELLREEKE